MRIIVAPAKKMRVDTDSLPCDGLPALLDRTRRLRDWVQGLSFEEKKRLWGCSDAIARRADEDFDHMDLEHELTPALIAYDGIQYSYMAPDVFDQDELAYVREHLRILSGFYGVLRPFDGVVPYRLELENKATVDGHRNLYELWGDAIYRTVMDGNDDATIINLASQQYARIVERHLQPGDRFVTCVFGELVGGRIVQRGVYAKMARGEMVRHLASIGAQDTEQLRSFVWSDYHYDEAHSTATSYVFVRAGDKG